MISTCQQNLLAYGTARKQKPGIPPGPWKLYRVKGAPTVSVLAADHQLVCQIPAQQDEALIAAILAIPTPRPTEDP